MPAAIPAAVGIGGSLLSGVMGNNANKAAQQNNDNQNNIQQQNAAAQNAEAQARIDSFIGKNSPSAKMGAPPPALNPASLMKQTGGTGANPMAPVPQSAGGAISPAVIAMVQKMLTPGAAPPASPYTMNTGGS